MVKIYKNLKKMIISINNWYDIDKITLKKVAHSARFS